MGFSLPSAISQQQVEVQQDLWLRRLFVIKLFEGVHNTLKYMYIKYLLKTNIYVNLVMLNIEEKRCLQTPPQHLLIQ